MTPLEIDLVLLVINLDQSLAQVLVWVLHLVPHVGEVIGQCLDPVCVLLYGPTGLGNISLQSGRRGMITFASQYLTILTSTPLD